MRCILDPELAPPMPPAEKGSILKGIVEVAPMVGLMLVILGSIYLGIATPTEAAAVGAFIAAIIAWAVRRPSLQAYGEALMNTVMISASILFIAVGAFIFNYAVQTTGIAAGLTKWVVALDLNVYVFLISMFVFYAILGCLVNSIGMIVMTVPLLLPHSRGLQRRPDLVRRHPRGGGRTRADHAAGRHQPVRRRFHRPGRHRPGHQGRHPLFLHFRHLPRCFC